MFFTLNKTLAWNFYRQNAGFFMFLFLVFFGVIAPSQQPAYHYALIRGMLAAPAFLTLVCAAWLLYALKIASFINGLFGSPEYVFLCLLNAIPRGRRYGLLLAIQGLLFIPVLAYSSVVAWVAWQKGAWPTAIFVLAYVIALCLLAAAWYLYRLARPKIQHCSVRQGSFSAKTASRHLPYWSILLRFLVISNPALLAGIKGFGCLILYLLLSAQTPGDYDLRMPYLVYSLAIFGHGILLFRCRALEITRLLYYLTLPISLKRRFGQYCLLYFLLLVPEILVLGWLTPDPIRLMDVLQMGLSGYSILLLMNSCLLFIPLEPGALLRLCLVIFGILYCCVLGGFLIAMSGFFFFAAAMLFFRGYYRCKFG